MPAQQQALTVISHLIDGYSRSKKYVEFKSRYNMNALLDDDIKTLRVKFKTLGVIVAEVDKELRYKWIENPHQDFDPNEVIGKRDDELVPAKEAEGIISLKMKVFETGKAQMATLLFNLSSGPCNYNIAGYPVKNRHGQTTSVITFGFYTELSVLKKV